MLKIYGFFLSAAYFCIHTGFISAGRAHDARVYRMSPLSETLERDLYAGPAALEDTYHILGDQAYPLSKNLLIPYQDRALRGGLTRQERKFNRHLSSKRQVCQCRVSELNRHFQISLVFNVHCLYICAVCTSAVAYISYTRNG